jgi:hypothetical protein
MNETAIGDNLPFEMAHLTKHPPINGANHQQFKFVKQGGYYEIIGRHSGGCLNIHENNADSGAKLKMITCKGESDEHKDAQLFHPIKINNSFILCECY